MKADLAAEVAKEDREWVDALVRRLAPELGDAVWGRNTRLRRRWVLRHQGSAWLLRGRKRAEGFVIHVDLTHPGFRIDCRDGDIPTGGLGEDQLRGALTVAHHRGPRPLAAAHARDGVGSAGAPPRKGDA